MKSKFGGFTGLLFLVLLQSCSFHHYAEKSLERARKNAPYDAVIVTGIPYDDSTTNGLIFVSRVLWAKFLYDRGITKNIIFSGGAIHSPLYEGLAMKIVADSLGIPATHTFAELQAEHSVENVWYGMKMAQRLGFNKIALACDPFQTKLLEGFLKSRCDDMPYIPTIYDSVISDRKRWHMLLPRVDWTGAIKPGYIALERRESFWERLRGTRGKHIKFE